MWVLAQNAFLINQFGKTEYLKEYTVQLDFWRK